MENKMNEKETAKQKLLDVLNTKSEKSPSSYIVDAIFDYIKSSGRKVNKNTLDVYGEMILDLFGDATLKENKELSEKFRSDAIAFENRYKEAYNEYKTYNNKLSYLQAAYDKLQSEFNKQYKKLEAEKNRLELENEELRKTKLTDPLLYHAKMAYHFMYNETNDYILASKAFNSYLLDRKPEINDNEKTEYEITRSNGRTEKPCIIL